MSYEKINFGMEWANLCGEQRDKLKVSKDFNGCRNTDEISRRLAFGEYKLMCFAERNRMASDALFEPLHPLDALRLYLINEHHWSLAQVRDLQTVDDLMFVLRRQVMNMKLDPQEAQPIATQLLGSDELLHYLPHFDLREDC